MRYAGAVLILLVSTTTSIWLGIEGKNVPAAATSVAGVLGVLVWLHLKK